MCDFGFGFELLVIDGYVDFAFCVDEFCCLFAFDDWSCGLLFVTGWLMGFSGMLLRELSCVSVTCLDLRGFVVWVCVHCV